MAWHGVTSYDHCPLLLVPAAGCVGTGGVYEGSEGDGYLLREAEGDLELPHASPGPAGKRQVPGRSLRENTKDSSGYSMLKFAPS